MRHKTTKPGARAGSRDHAIVGDVRDPEINPNAPSPASLPLYAIVADADCQLRAAGSAATVADYTEALVAGATFPPVIAFHDGDRYWLADGFHRFEAHRAAGLTEIMVEVRAGGLRDAKLFAAGANAKHGLRRTQADKRKAIEVLLADPEWRKWSDREIARRTSTSDKTVAAVRRDLSGAGVNAEIRTEARKFVSKHGTEATRRVTPVREPAGGMVERVLRGLSDEVLLAEVRRRGVAEERPLEAKGNFSPQDECIMSVKQQCFTTAKSIPADQVEEFFANIEQVIAHLKAQAMEKLVRRRGLVEGA